MKTNASDFYSRQSETVRRLTPDFINALQAEYKNRERAIQAAFDAVPTGRSKDAKAAQAAARQTLVQAIADLDNWYEAEFLAWEKNQ